MASPLVIYNWDDVETLATVFSAIKKIAENSDVQTAINTILLAGISIYVVRVFIRGKDLFQSFLLFFIGTLTLLFLFTKWKVDVVVTNPSTLESSSLVTGVPGVIAYAAHISSKAEKVLLDIIEEYFQTPSGINYSHTGYNYGGILFSSLPKLKVRNPYILRSMKEYITGCFFEDIIRGYKDFDVMYTTDNLWEYIRPASVGTLPVLYYTADNPEGVIMTCNEVYSNLDSELSTLSENEFNSLIETLTNVKNEPTDWVSAAFNDFLGTSMDKVKVYKNTVASRYMYDSLQYAAVNSTISSNISEYAKQIAKNNIFSGWEISGNIGRELIPMIKNFILLLMVAVYPFLLFLIFTPMARSYIRMFIVLFLWIALWSPMFAIITYLAHLRLEELLKGVITGTDGYSMASMPGIFEQAINHIAVWNYLSLLVPTLSFVLAKASEYAIVNFASGFMRAFEGVGGRIGATLSTPQEAGRLSGEAREVSIYGTDLSYNRVADQTFYGAVSSYGRLQAINNIERFSPGSVRRAAYAETEESIARNRYMYDNPHLTPEELGKYKAVSEIISGMAYKEATELRGNLDNVIIENATKQGLDKAVAGAFIKAIDYKFGDKDGKLTLKEAKAYASFLENSKIADFATKQRNMEELANIFMAVDKGLSFQEALILGASAVGMGQAYFHILKGIKSRADYQAIKEYFGGLDKYASFLEKMGIMNYAKDSSRISNLISMYRQVYGDKAKGLSDMKILQKLGSLFGISKAGQELYGAQKFISFYNEAGKDAEKMLNLAVMEGFIDAEQKKALSDVISIIGKENMRKLINTGTFGSFLMKFALGSVNNQTLEALGDGDYLKGVNEFARINAEGNKMELWKKAAVIDKVADYYMKKNPNISRNDAIRKASKELGFVEGSQNIGAAELAKYGDALIDAYKTENVGKVAELIGEYYQSNKDLGQLFEYMREKGAMSVAQAKAMKELSNLLDERIPGVNEKDANYMYQLLATTGLLNRLAVGISLGGLASIGMLIDQFRNLIDDKFNPNRRTIRNLLNPKDRRVLEALSNEFGHILEERSRNNPRLQGYLKKLQALSDDITNNRITPKEAYKRQLKLFKDMFKEGAITLDDLRTAIDNVIKQGEAGNWDRKTLNNLNNIRNHLSKISDSKFQDYIEKLASKGVKKVPKGIVARMFAGFGISFLGGPFMPALDALIFVDTVLQLATGKSLFGRAIDEALSLFDQWSQNPNQNKNLYETAPDYKLTAEELFDALENSDYNKDITDIKDYMDDPESKKKSFKGHSKRTF